MPDLAEVLVATTWRCNLRCTYCFLENHGVLESGVRMRAKTATRVVDALDEGLDEVDTICIHLYGGEPLTNLVAAEAMLDRADQKPAGRFSFAVTTNGTCLSDRTIELLERGRFQVILSIDGPAPVHDECRLTSTGRPTHARVMAFLEALRSRTPCHVRASSVVRSGWRLADAQSYLRSLDVDAIKAQAVRSAQGAPHTLTAQERKTYVDDLAAVGRQVIEEVEAGRMPKDDRFSNRVLQQLAGMRREAFCAAGDTTFGITPDGEVLPCVLLEEEGSLLGHVDDDPARWRAAGRLWRAASPRRDECHGCPALPMCGGGCPAIMPVCGADECDLVRSNCEVATGIYEHFRSRPEKLLVLAGIA